MLHVLLLILKIVGLILAALLGVILILLILLLFVPFRYRIFVSRRGEWLVRGKISWLFHILSLPVVFEKGEFSAKLKIFGLTVKSLSEEEEELEEETERFFWDAGEAAKEKEEDWFREEPSGEAGHTDERQLPAVCPQTETEILQNRPADQPEEPKREEEVPSGTRKKNMFTKLLEKLRSLARIFTGFSKKIRNLKYTFRRFCVRIKRGIRKIQETKAFLTDERTRSAFHAAVREILVLSKALQPRRIRGEVHFGTEDPALTGEILGGIGIFYPVFMDNVKVIPDFEQPVLEGELFAKGRLRLMTVLRIALRLWMDKNVRYVYRKLN